jgi:hypothetical protein
LALNRINILIIGIPCSNCGTEQGRKASGMDSARGSTIRMTIPKSVNMIREKLIMRDQDSTTSDGKTNTD